MVSARVSTASGDVESKLIQSVGLATLACACLGFGAVCAFTLADGVAPGRDPGPDGGINPNHAAAVSLARLPGVGPTRAQAIVAYREALAGHDGEVTVFRRPEDLGAVKGIGPVTVEKMRPWLSLEDPPGPSPPGTGRP